MLSETAASLLARRLRHQMMRKTMGTTMKAPEPIAQASHAAQRKGMSNWKRNKSKCLRARRSLCARLRLSHASYQVALRKSISQ
jgi:hypothetical protein